MPIKINLLAEEQAAEDLRRRDPLKRSIYAAVTVVSIFIIWSLAIWGQLSGLSGQIESLIKQKSDLEKPSKETEANKKKVAEAKLNQEMLKKLAAARPLWGPVMDALQRSLDKDVQLLRLRVDQSYQITPAVVPPRGSGVKGKPASSKQVIVMTIEAQDASGKTDNYNKVIQQLSVSLRDSLGTNGTVLLKNMNPPREIEDGKKVSTYSLECVFTEVVR